MAQVESGKWQKSSDCVFDAVRDVFLDGSLRFDGIGIPTYQNIKFSHFSWKLKVSCQGRKLQQKLAQNQKNHICQTFHSHSFSTTFYKLFTQIPRLVIQPHLFTFVHSFIHTNQENYFHQSPTQEYCTHLFSFHLHISFLPIPPILSTKLPISNCSCWQLLVGGRMRKVIT